MKIKKILFCSIKGCEDNFYAKGYCKRHYQQIKRNGMITNYTIHRKNNYIVENNVATLELYDKKGNIAEHTIIDKEDLDRVLQYKWYYTSYGYATTTLKNHKNLFLHRYITKCPRNKVVDHINHNTLDNRKCNLKVCSQLENMQNLKKKARGITTLNRNGNTYYIVQLKGKYLGCFKTLVEAQERKEKILMEVNI